MLLNLSQHSDQTLQEQIIVQIRYRILRGDLKPDEPLTSIRELSRKLRVAVNTVQRAYEHLLHEGLVYARQGKGFFVAPLEVDDRVRIARQRFTEALRTLMTETRREGLLDGREMRQIFGRLQNGTEDSDA
jgi:GntR family transcriptional regulator